MPPFCLKLKRNFRNTQQKLCLGLEPLDRETEVLYEYFNTYEEIEVATIAIDNPSKNEIEADDLVTVVYPFQSEDLQRLPEERLRFSAIFLLTLMSMGSIDTTEQHFEWSFAKK